MLMNCLIYHSTLSCIQFADDTSIFIRGISLPKITSILNQEMEKIIDWLNLNMLTINVSKTNYMIMTAQGKRIIIKNVPLLSTVQL